MFSPRRHAADGGLRPKLRQSADGKRAFLVHAASNVMFEALHSHSTGLALLDAQYDFDRAHRAYLVATVGGWLRRLGSRSCPRALADSVVLAPGESRLEVVPLRAIVGTLDPTSQFDADFRPASNAVRRRWQRIALAYRKGEVLPPIVLRRQPDGFYVVDGRHRVSVARALGQRDIDAWVSGPRPGPRPDGRVIHLQVPSAGGDLSGAGDPEDRSSSRQAQPTR